MVWEGSTSNVTGIRIRSGAVYQELVPGDVEPASARKYAVAELDMVAETEPATSSVALIVTTGPKSDTCAVAGVLPGPLCW